VLHTNIEPDLPKRGLNRIMRGTIAACAILEQIPVEFTYNLRA